MYANIKKIISDFRGVLDECRMWQKQNKRKRKRKETTNRIKIYETASLKSIGENNSDK